MAEKEIINEKGKKILIIEDEIPLLNVLGRKLEEAGFRVIGAVNGEEGYVTAIKRHPDLILLDLLMPVMGGIDFLAKLREDEWGKKANVSVITNLSDPDKQAQAEGYGVIDFITKADWSIEKIVARISEVLESGI